MTTQPTLFDPPPIAGGPHTKAGAPRTSRDAADSVAPELGALQRAVLGALASASLTADEIAARLYRTVLSIRPRVSELHDAGLVRETEQRRANASGRMAVVWTLTSRGLAKLEDLR